MNEQRYIAVYIENLRCWRIRDRKTGAIFGHFDTKFQTNKAIDSKVARELKKNAGKTADYGMRRGGPVPQPRSYKDN